MILLIYNYSQEVRDLFYTDSIRKKLTINLSENPIDLFEIGGSSTFEIYRTLSDEEIISESMEFSEALSEETNFTFRSFSLPQLSVERVFEQYDFTGCACTCILTIYEQDRETPAAYILLLDGYVLSDEASEDRKTRKLTCISSVSQILDKEVFSHINKNVYTVAGLLANAFSPFSIFKGEYNNYGTIDIYQITSASPQFNELDYNVNFSNFQESYTYKDLLLDVIEALGCFCLFYKGNISPVSGENYNFINKDIILIRPNFNLGLLYPNNNVYPSNSAQYGLIYPLYSFAENEYVTLSPSNKLPWYKKVAISTKPNYPYNYFSVYIGNNRIFRFEGYHTNNNLEYTIKDNKLLEQADRDEIVYITGGVTYMIYYLNFFRIKLEMPYLAYLQPGDSILIENEWGTYVMPIVKVEVKGINSLNATVTCEFITQ